MDFLKAKDAAAYIGVGMKKLDALTKEQKIPVYQERAGCSRKYSREDLDVYMGTIRKTPPKINPYTTYRKRRNVPA